MEMQRRGDDTPPPNGFYNFEPQALVPTLAQCNVGGIGRRVKPAAQLREMLMTPVNKNRCIAVATGLLSATLLGLAVTLTSEKTNPYNLRGNAYECYFWREHCNPLAIWGAYKHEIISVGRVVVGLASTYALLRSLHYLATTTDYDSKKVQYRIKTYLATKPFHEIDRQYPMSILKGHALLGNDPKVYALYKRMSDAQQIIRESAANAEAEADAVYSRRTRPIDREGRRERRQRLEAKVSRDFSTGVLEFFCGRCRLLRCHNKISDCCSLLGYWISSCHREMRKMPMRNWHSEEVRRIDQAKRDAINYIDIQWNNRNAIAAAIQE